MKELFEKYIRSKVVRPSEQGIQEVLDLFEVTYFAKNEYVKKPFSVDRTIGFLASGLVKGEISKENGDEVTFQLLEGPSFVGDPFSIRTNTSTPIAFKCVTDVCILLASVDPVQDLLQTNLVLNIVLREYITEKAAEIGRRHLLFLTESARERYLFITKNRPDLIDNLPLREIASLIGISPVQLSRIRRKISD